MWLSLDRRRFEIGDLAISFFTHLIHLHGIFLFSAFCLLLQLAGFEIDGELSADNYLLDCII